MKTKTILLLGGKDVSTNIVFNALNEHFDITCAIIEDKEPIKVFLKRRIKRLGLPRVIGQILFRCTVPALQNIFSKKRYQEIIKANHLNLSNIPAAKLKQVRSINSKQTIDLLQTINPDLVIVNGTRIISKKVLQSLNCAFINTHAGITPMYRGAHGTYWALVNRDVENSGVTVHFIDEGIDTGNIISQSQVTPTSKDNFSTYPLLQLSSGIKLLIPAIENYFNESIETLHAKGESKLYYHPTIWEYVYYRITRKVK